MSSPFQNPADLLVFDNYSEPADLRTELSATLLLKEEGEDDDPLYMSPLDDRGTAPPLPLGEEDMYCLPYDDEPPLPQPCRVPGEYRKVWPF